MVRRGVLRSGIELLLVMLLWMAVLMLRLLLGGRTSTGTSRTTRFKQRSPNRSTGVPELA